MIHYILENQQSLSFLKTCLRGEKPTEWKMSKPGIEPRSLTYLPSQDFTLFTLFVLRLLSKLKKFSN